MSHAAHHDLPQRVSDRAFFAANGVLSALAVSFIAFILLREHSAAGPDLSFLPALNACFNALSAACLIAGYIAIRKQNVSVHRLFMVTAFASSSVFLVGYLSYHFVNGDTHYTGTGAIRLVYFTLLISHIVLSLGVVPMALTSFYFAFTRAFARHRRLNRVLLPIWLYVSVTGVVIFFMLRG